MDTTTKTIISIIAICVIVQSCPIVQSDPADEQDQIDAVIILPDGIATEFFLPQIKVVAESDPIPEVKDKVKYEDLKYNETTPENVQEFLDYIPPCPWYKDTATNMCSLNARYIAIEAKEHGLKIGECTVVDTDADRVKRTLLSGHRVNVFEHNGTKYFTTNLCKVHSDVVTVSELCNILHDRMGIDRIGTKDYKWEING